MEMNKHSFSVEHTWKGDEMDDFNPNWVDTVAIMYPNGRRYYYVEFAEPDKYECSHKSTERSQKWTECSLKWTGQVRMFP